MHGSQAVSRPIPLTFAHPSSLSAEQSCLAAFVLGFRRSLSWPMSRVRDWAGGDAVLSRSQTTYYGALMVGARGARGEVHCRALCGRRQSALGGPP